MDELKYDEGVRASIDLAKMAMLPTVFKKDGEERKPILRSFNSRYARYRLVGERYRLTCKREVTRRQLTYVIRLRWNSNCTRHCEALSPQP